MMEENGMAKRLITGTIAAALMLAIMVSLCLAAGEDISSYKYPSYLLQAQAWLRGEAKLDQNYESLELAIYEGDYYVSFPPAPSVPMVLWSLIFGSNVPAGLFQKIYVMIAGILIFSELARRKDIAPKHAAAWSVLLCLGSALLPITMAGAVWYEAQILAFLFCIGAIAALRRNKRTLACLCYALAVGCRPFTVLLGPVLLAMHMKLHRDLPVKKRLTMLLPGIFAGLCVAAVYGWYNYIRFGNPLEFGHNYLPEFMRAEHGQLSLVYLWQNLKDFLFRFPWSFEESGTYFNAFGFSMFISCPVFIVNLVWIIRDLVRRNFSMEKALILLMGAVNVILLCMHRTLGGYQFGARYAIELIPLCFCYLLADPESGRMHKWEAALLICGLIFNFAGGYFVHV